LVHPRGVEADDGRVEAIDIAVPDLRADGAASNAPNDQ